MLCKWVGSLEDALLLFSFNEFCDLESKPTGGSFSTIGDAFESGVEWGEFNLMPGI